MSRRVLVLLFLALASIIGASDLPAAPLDDLDACAERLDDAPADGKKLVDLCPQLDRALDEAGFTPQLDDGERALKKPEVLWDLAELGRRYAGTPRGPVPGTLTLAGIADALNSKAAAPAEGWWDRVREWLRQWFAKHAPPQGNWLDRWLQHLAKSSHLLTVISYFCMALVVIGAIVVVVNELRATGMLSRGGRTDSAEDGTRPGPVPIAPGDMGSGVGRLLAELIARLVATGRLRAARTLTHRELILHSTLDTEQQKSTFARVALAAESVTYGPSGTLVPEQLMQQGNALLSEMTAPPPKGAQ